MSDELDKLTPMGCWILRSAVEKAIEKAEADIARPALKDLRPDAKAYFEDQHRQTMEALPVLRALSKRLWVLSVKDIT
jgi:hypothetical protein